MGCGSQGGEGLAEEAEEARPGGLAAVTSLALGNSPPPAEIQTLPGDSAGGITPKVAYSSTIAY